MYKLVMIEHDRIIEVLKVTSMVKRLSMNKPSYMDL